MILMSLQTDQLQPLLTHMGELLCSVLDKSGVKVACRAAQPSHATIEQASVSVPTVKRGSF